MSKVLEPGYCYCSCHDDRHGMMSMHCVPCCDGRCKQCLRYVARGRMEEHIWEHQRAIDQAMKDLDESGE